MPVLKLLPRLVSTRAFAAGSLVALALLAACGGGDDSREATASPTSSPTPEVAASATPEAVSEAVSSAFPGLPLDKIAAMVYNPDERRLTLTTVLPAGAIAEGEGVCRAFIDVALFADDASIYVVANDYSPLARCARS
jgi:hypothetical protein